MCPTKVDKNNWSRNHAEVEHQSFGTSSIIFDTKLIPSPETPLTPNRISIRSENWVTKAAWALHLVFYCCPPPPPIAGCNSPYLADDIIFVFDETVSVNGAELASAHQFATNLITAFDATAQVYDTAAVDVGPHVGVISFSKHAVQEFGFTNSSYAKLAIANMPTAGQTDRSSGTYEDQAHACPGNAMKAVLTLLQTSRPLASTLVVFITDSMGSAAGCTEQANRMALLQQLRTTADRILAVGVNKAIFGTSTEVGIDHAWLESLSKNGGDQQKWLHLTPRSANSFQCDHAVEVEREDCYVRTQTMLSLLEKPDPTDSFLSIWTPVGGGYTGANGGNYNVNTPASPLHMHLDRDYTQFKDSAGKMTMQLRWPELTPSTLTWKQSSSPLSMTVTGFEIDANEHWGPNGRDHFSFSGIHRSNQAQGHTLLEGVDSHFSWWFAVGTAQAFRAGIPGPFGKTDCNSGAYGCVVKNVELWVKSGATWTLLVKQDNGFFPKRDLMWEEIPVGCSMKTVGSFGEAHFKTEFVKGERTPLARTSVEGGGNGDSSTPYQRLCEAPYISTPTFDSLLQLDLMTWAEHHACRTSEPTSSPTWIPTAAPSTAAPSLAPTFVPTQGPSFSGTCSPSEASACDATQGECFCAVAGCATKSCRCKQGFGCNDASCGTCTTKPTAAPTVAPSAQPTTMPTTAPTAAPSATPTIWGDFGVLCSFLFSRIKSENLTHLSLSLPRPCNRRRRFRAGGAG